MKIGFFTDTYAPTIDGIAISVELFRRELVGLGHEVYIICPAASGRTKSVPKHEIRLPSWPGLWYEGYRDTLPWTAKNIDRIKDLQLDLIHTHTPAQIGVLGLQIANSQGIPLVTTYHTDIEQYAKVYLRLFPGLVALMLLAPVLMKDFTLYRQTLPLFKPERNLRAWNQKVVRKGIALYMSYSDLVIAPSPKMKTLLESYGVKKTIEVLPTGLPPITKPAAGSFRAAHHLPKEAQIVLFSGRLGAEKNIELFIRTAAILSKTHPQLYFCLAGDGPHRAKLEQLIKRARLSERFILTGMISQAELARVYSDADVFFFPSLTDTQGLVTSEAAQYGLPLVYVDDQISPITQDGVNGLKVDHTATSAARAIGRILGDRALAKRFGAESQRLAATISMPNQAKLLAGYYQAMLDRIGL